MCSHHSYFPLNLNQHRSRQARMCLTFTLSNRINWLKRNPDISKLQKLITILFQLSINSSNFLVIKIPELNLSQRRIYKKSPLIWERRLSFRTHLKQGNRAMWKWWNQMMVKLLRKSYIQETPESIMSFKFKPKAMIWANLR